MVGTYYESLNWYNFAFNHETTSAVHEYIVNVAEIDKSAMWIGSW